MNKGSRTSFCSFIRWTKMICLLSETSAAYRRRKICARGCETAFYGKVLPQVQRTWAQALIALVYGRWTQCLAAKPALTYHAVLIIVVALVVDFGNLMLAGRPVLYPNSPGKSRL
jgi:hypothetical protein